MDDLLAQDEWLVASTKQGRSRGQSNFKVDEDMKLAASYAFITTNAAIGTDQDGATFWEKIRGNFVKRGGGMHRTTVSLQNRFNKVLQAEVNKYIGFLQSSLREYHSGWVMDDYICDAKKRYQLKFGKIFKHESVHRILKKSLPKYEIVISSCEARVGRALFLMTNDDDVLDKNHANEEDNEGSTLEEEGINNIQQGNSKAVKDSSLVTPRPSVGKKKAKLMEFAERCRVAPAAKTMCNDAATNKVEFYNAAKTFRNNSLNRLAAAAEAKNLLAQEQLMLQLFMQNPDSAQSKAYFVTMGQRYTLQMQQFKNINTTTAMQAPADGGLPASDDEEEGVQLCPLEEELPKTAGGDDDKDEEYCVVTSSRSAHAAAAERSYYNRRSSHNFNDDDAGYIARLFCHAGAVAGDHGRHTPGALLSPGLVHRDDERNNDNENDYADEQEVDQTFSLPPTQRLEQQLGQLTSTDSNNNQEYEDDEDDTQLTTLSK